MEQLKTCSKCKAHLPITSFYKKKGVAAPSCKECHNKHILAYRDKNRELVLKQSRDRYQKNKERRQAQGRAFHQKNKERLNEKARARHQKNKERHNARSRNYYQNPEHREQRKARSRYYRDKHREELNEKTKIRDAQDIEQLTDRYIKSLIFNASHGLFTRNNIPAHLIEEKRKQLQLKRLNGPLPPNHWYYANKEKARAWRETYIEENRDNIKLSRAIHYEHNCETIKKSKLRDREDLHDTYIKQILRGRSTLIKFGNIPQTLIEAKRAHLKVKRIIKEKQK